MYNGNTKSDLFDLIYTAKSQLIAQEAKEHKDNKHPLPYDKINGVSQKENERIKNFIRDPINSLRKEFTDLANRPENANEKDEDKLIFNDRLETNAAMLYSEISIGREKGAHEYGNHPDRIDVMARLTSKIKDRNVDETIKRVNSGIFGRLFRRPSKQYQAFEDSLKEFKEAGKAHAGNIEDLEKKTTEYLKHTIPDFDPEKMDQNKNVWLSCIPKSKIGRAQLAMDVLGSIREHKQMKPYMDNVENAVKGRPIDKSLDNGKLSVEEEKQMQNDFQKQINKQIAEPEEQYDIPMDSNEIVNNTVKKHGDVKNNKDIEEEKLDASEAEITK